MNLHAAEEMARAGRLYPSVILHGGDPARRREAAVLLARTLLCGEESGRRPCGACGHCRRVAWREGPGAPFHPDFLILERDLRTVTSVAATKEFLRSAQSAPFEARGQVFVVASAESLSGGAANALLKSLEEPHDRAPRNFLLLTPSRLDLLPTLRSRSLSVYLGSASSLEREAVERLAEGFADSMARFYETSAPVHLMAAAAVLRGAGGWEDPRAAGPWALAAGAVVGALEHPGVPAAARGPALALASDLLEAPEMRLRGVSPLRILEGLVFRRLGNPVTSGPR